MFKIRKVSDKLRKFYDNCMSFISIATLVRQRQKAIFAIMQIKINSRYYFEIRLPYAWHFQISNFIRWGYRCLTTLKKSASA